MVRCSSALPRECSRHGRPLRATFVRLSKILCLVALLLPNLAVSETATERIGFVLPLSGEWAELGAGVRNGALLAAPDGVELYFEDNRGELALSATIARRLIEERKVGAIVSIISGRCRKMEL